MIWAWALFRRSLTVQIIAGIAAFLAAWAANNAIVGHKAKQAERKKIVQASEKKGRERNAKVRKIRRNTPRAGAWERLRREYARGD